MLVLYIFQCLVLIAFGSWIGLLFMCSFWVLCSLRWSFSLFSLWFKVVTFVCIPSHIDIPRARVLELRIAVLRVSFCPQNRRRKQYTRIFPSRFGACSDQGKQTILNATRQYPSIRPGASTCCCQQRNNQKKNEVRKYIKSCKYCCGGAGGR